MKKKHLNTMIMFALLGGLSLSAVAQPGPGQRTRPRQYQQQRGPFIPDLTEEQKEQIKAIMTDRRQTAEPLMDEYRINQARLKAVLNDDEPDMKEVKSLVEANGALMTQVKINRIESQIAVRNLLTEEQQIAFETRKKRFQHRRHRSNRDARWHRPDRSMIN